MIGEFLRYLNLELNRSRLTVKAYESDLCGFNDFIKDTGVAVGDSGFFVPAQVSVSHVRMWVSSLMSAGNSPASVRRKIQSLRSYFRFLVKAGLIDTNPAAAVPLPKTGRKLPSIASHDDISLSISLSESTLEALVLELLYGCGLRRAELLALTDRDFNFSSRELKILGKGNKHRIIPLPPELLAKISAWQQERDSLYPGLADPKPVIATKNGAMSQSTLYSLVRKALQGSNAGKKSPHTLRHSFATQLLNSGADINSVKELLGHSSLGTTQIYTHLAFSELTKEWAKGHPRARTEKK